MCIAAMILIPYGLAVLIVRGVIIISKAAIAALIPSVVMRGHIASAILETKGVLKIMSNKTVSLSVSVLSNGAAFAKALYDAGVDITDSKIARTFSRNIPFSKVAKIARDTTAVSDKKTVAEMMQRQIDSAELWSLSYDSMMDESGDKDKAVAYATEAVRKFESGESLDDSPTTPATPRKSSLPKAESSKVKPYNPKAESRPEWTEGQLFKFEGSQYRVGKRLVNGDYRVTLTNKNSIHRLGKFEGQTVTIESRGFLVGKSKDTYSNLTPIKTESPKAESPKAESPKAESSDDKLLATLTNPAVLAVLRELLNS